MSADDWIPKEEEALILKLREMDAQFDNLAIQFDRFVKSVETKSDKTNEKKELLHESTEGHSVTKGVSEADLDLYCMESKQYLFLSGNRALWEVAPVINNSPLGQLGMVNVADSTKHPRFIVGHIDLRNCSSSVVRLMLNQFCFGIGYGSHIVRINQIESEDGFAVVDAEMRLWSTDTTLAKLKIDSNWIVREATLVANTKGNETRFEISTKGTTDSDSDIKMATSGELKRTALTAVSGREKVDLGQRVDEDYRLNLLHVRGNITDSVIQRNIKVHSQFGLSQLVMESMFPLAR
ncbi:hypothetical protein [Polystyrenella longa]|uniref:hypothetical protein n=1 Tax=Polystyrenella longa TaxID=2528007 RepID=UPI0011A5032F|nr:hypothetical protein [Polystyrenella longa]